MQMLSPSPLHPEDILSPKCSTQSLFPLSLFPQGLILCPLLEPSRTLLVDLWSLTKRLWKLDIHLAFAAGMVMQFPPAPLLLTNLRAHFLGDTAISWLDLKWQQGSHPSPSPPSFTSMDSYLVSLMSLEGVTSYTDIEGVTSYNNIVTAKVKLSQDYCGSSFCSL